MLMFVILGVSTGAKEKGVAAGIAVGGAVAVGALFGGPISGASMNPARSLGPAVASGQFQFLWIYLTAPVLGASWAVERTNRRSPFAHLPQVSHVTLRGRAALYQTRRRSLFSRGLSPGPGLTRRARTDALPFRFLAALLCRALLAQQLLNGERLLRLSLKPAGRDEYRFIPNCHLDYLA
jgi:hypothetical protein